MKSDEDLEPRQIWALATTTTGSLQRHCRPFTLQSNGVLTIGTTQLITLTQNAVFKPACTGEIPPVGSNSSGSNSTILDLRDPFYASTSPQIYAIAAATVISYMLVIILFITPRTSYVGGTGGGNGFLGQHSMLGGSASRSIVGVGSRPWLQKVAALTVAISLTMATVDTFNVAEQQYDLGYQDAVALTDEVVGGLEIRIVRVVSDTFLWLAQVQTLIRLFPRQREKVIIKWTGFALIMLDTTFSIVNSFADSAGKTRPRSFDDAIPALTYLFELALSLLYAAWVMYYSFDKRRFAFFHYKMRNICLVALISNLAILIPVVFFVLDISQPDVAGWGDYMRWVGAAAASVVVWEWVERIEALERDEMKDGILGREIFDGDEMLEVTPSVEVNWPRDHQDSRPSGGGGAHRVGRSSGWDQTAVRMTRSRQPPEYSQPSTRNNASRPTGTSQSIMNGALPNISLPPPSVASPVSRADTNSAASTIYAVHYHPVSTTTTPTPCLPETESSESSTTAPPRRGMIPHTVSPTVPAQQSTSFLQGTPERSHRWRNVKNSFKRRRTSPPPEVIHASVNLFERATERGSQVLPENGQRSSKLGKLELVRNINKTKAKFSEDSLPTVVVPAQPRGRIWTPANDEVSFEGQDAAPLAPASEGEVGTQTGQHLSKSEQFETTTGPGSGSTILTGDPTSGASINTRSLQPFIQHNYSRAFQESPPNQRIISQRGSLVIAEEPLRYGPSYSPSAPPPSAFQSFGTSPPPHHQCHPGSPVYSTEFSRPLADQG
ncbi:pH-response regulator protein palH/rim21 [Bachmanniomyces sp. S44760]|nr:pH-response regulator protein palH/rim21 [Bachmanniomyces sp. S44760]